MVLLAVLAAPLRATTLPSVSVEGTPEEHTVSWTSSPYNSYSLEMSLDLGTWSEILPMQPGTGQAMSYTCSVSTNCPVPLSRVYYRVRQHCLGFWSRPLPTESFLKDEGVCIAFDPSCLPADTACLTISILEGVTWKPIGKITEFITDGTLKHVRGSSVWLPDAFGEFQMKATAKNASGTELVSEIRTINVTAPQLPSVYITYGPPASVSSGYSFGYAVETDAPADGGPATRVEFYEDGASPGTEDDLYIGEVVGAPFLSSPLGRNGEGTPNPSSLYRGSHKIKAIAYDSRGRASAPSAPWPTTVITSGNARPVLSITSPTTLFTVTSGTDVSVSFTASDPDFTGPMPVIEARGAGGAVLKQITNWESGPIEIPTGSLPLGPQYIAIAARDGEGVENYPQYVRLCVVPFGTATGEALAAAIADPATAAPSNAKLYGHPWASGLFNDGIPSGLQINSGAVLTTGNALHWNGGNTKFDMGSLWFYEGDSILEDQIVGTETWDAAVLEFDVTCANGQLEGEYQFGSEEYDEYIVPLDYGDCFNDAFLITVNGAPLSLAPDCGDIIACHSVHPLISWMTSECGLAEDLPPLRRYLYLDNITEVAPLVYPGYLSVEYDGVIKALKWRAFVSPGQVCRIRISIADANDQSLDSALFLGGGTVRSIIPVP